MTVRVTRPNTVGIGVLMAMTLAACGVADTQSDSSTRADTPAVDGRTQPLEPDGGTPDVLPTEDVVEPVDGSSPEDAVVNEDAVAPEDVAAPQDAGLDAFVPVDSGTEDGAVDASVGVDVVVPIDTGTDSGPGCTPVAAVPGDGHHNPGTVCTGCHTGGAAPAWTVSGTLYDSATGSAPVAGATVHVIDSTGADIVLVTATNGNFYTVQPVSFPVHTNASRCPSTISMLSAVTGSTSCNSCHGAGARIHLP